MALYRYVKAHPQVAFKPEPQIPVATISLPLFTLPTFVPYLLMALGGVLILTVLSPIVYHELVIFPQLKKVTLLSPVPNTAQELQQLTQVAGTTTAAPSALASPETESPTPDYTQASNWFPTAPLSQPTPSKITHYTIDIPELDIENAVVEIGGNDLKKTLIQYGGTANPGEYGSAVIFGHSVLRQFYNPSVSNPNRYMSIFSTIMTLKTGDEIFVNFDGIRYAYKVTDKYEVRPEQVEVLQQRYDRQFIKLITCVPEGTYLRRGVIEAQLVQTS